jgi:hypothetical protein
LFERLCKHMRSAVPAMRWTSYTSCITIIITVSQKVPGMLVLHRNGTTYGNAYLITFKVGPLHTHFLHQSYHCWKQQQKASLAIFQSSTIAYNLMSSMVIKHAPLWPIFGVRVTQS